MPKSKKELVKISNGTSETPKTGNYKQRSKNDEFS